jgi:hypothetical protein
VPVEDCNNVKLLYSMQREEAPPRDSDRCSKMTADICVNYPIESDCINE